MASSFDMLTSCAALCSDMVQQLTAAQNNKQGCASLRSIAALIEGFAKKLDLDELTPDRAATLGRWSQIAMCNLQCSEWAQYPVLLASTAAVTDLGKWCLDPEHGRSFAMCSPVVLQQGPGYYRPVCCYQSPTASVLLPLGSCCRQLHKQSAPSYGRFFCMAMASSLQVPCMIACARCVTW